MKKKILLGLAVVYVAAMGWLLWRYQAQAPSRSASAFLNTISQNADINGAYNMTSSGLQQHYTKSLFSHYFSTLNGSKAKYLVLSQQKTGSNAVVSGVVEDLQGRNYMYIFHLHDTGGRWLVDSMFANPQ